MNRSIALLLPLVVVACARDTSGKYPSLALRPIETRSDDEPVADAAPAPVAADPAADAMIATSGAAIDRNAADFATAAGKARAAASRPGATAQGSSAWLDAQASLADLEALHGDLLAIAADLDRAATDRAQAGQPPYPPLTAVQAKVQAQIGTQDATIAQARAASK